MRTRLTFFCLFVLILASVACQATNQPVQDRSTPAKQPSPRAPNSSPTPVARPEPTAAIDPANASPTAVDIQSISTATNSAQPAGPEPSFTFHIVESGETITILGLGFGGLGYGGIRAVSLYNASPDDHLTAVAISAGPSDEITYSMGLNLQFANKLGMTIGQADHFYSDEGTITFNNPQLTGNPDSEKQVRCELNGSIEVTAIHADGSFDGTFDLHAENTEADSDCRFLNGDKTSLAALHVKGTFVNIPRPEELRPEMATQAAVELVQSAPYGTLSFTVAESGQTFTFSDQYDDVFVGPPMDMSAFGVKLNYVLISARPQIRIAPSIEFKFGYPTGTELSFGPQDDLGNDNRVRIYFPDPDPERARKQYWVHCKLVGSVTITKIHEDGSFDGTFEMVSPGEGNCRLEYLGELDGSTEGMQPPYPIIHVTGTFEHLPGPK